MKKVREYLTSNGSVIIAWIWALISVCLVLQLIHSAQFVNSGQGIDISGSVNAKPVVLFVIITWIKNIIIKIVKEGNK